MRSLAERLTAYEASGNEVSRTDSAGLYLIDNKLRPHLAALMGTVGFSALLSRALVLANAEVPWLRAAHVELDGSLQGLDELETQLDSEEIFEGSVVLLAQLLGLLTAFIGENLTLRLMREVWPKLNDLDFGQRQT
jgi:hypothetical protein